MKAVFRFLLCLVLAVVCPVFHFSTSAEDAFSMCPALKTVRIPETLSGFSLPPSSGAVVICPQSEEIEEDLLRRGIPYLAGS